MFTRKILVTLFVGSALNASADGLHYRFWRGDRIAGMSAETFRDGLRQVFVPTTLKQGVGKGLLAYQPVLFAKDHSPKLPDEVALVTYVSEEEYKRLRATPEGKAYGEMHWEYFARETSRSTVPEAFTGLVEAGKAYDLLGGTPDWSLGTSVYRVFLRRSHTSEADFLKLATKTLGAIQKSPTRGLKAHIALVTEDYVMEFSLWEEGNPAQTLPARGREWTAATQNVTDIRPREWDGRFEFNDAVRLSARTKNP